MSGRPLVCLSVFRCVCQGIHPMGGRSAKFHENLREGDDKNPGSTNRYNVFGQLIIRKVIKIIATRCHILRLKCTEFDSWRLSVCLFVRLCL